MEYKLEKNKKKKQIILIILTIILSLGITLGAVNFIYYFNDQRENSISTALITLNYTDKTGGNIELANMLPVIDQIGIENTPYEFSVTNTSKVPININFQIIENEETTIPLGAIRYALYINDELITKSHLANLDEDGNFYVFENVEPREKINCKLVFWVDYYYEESNETFSAKLKIIGESRDVIGEIEPTFVDILKERVGTGGLVAINTDGTLYDETDTTEEIREYRYSGLDVNNYVFFDTNADGIKTNDEIWRIVGIFKDIKKDSNGNIITDLSGEPLYEEKVKLVRNTVLTSSELPTSYTINGVTNTIENGTTGTAYWNYVKTGTNYNDWTTAGLQYYLNTLQDESSTPNKGYLNLFSEEVKDLLSLTTYYLGNVRYNLDTANGAYNSERNQEQIYSGNQSSWNSLVSLLYSSDYGYSTTSNYWNTVLYNYSDVAKTYSWIYQSLNHISDECLLSPSADATNYAMNWRITGYIGYASTSKSHAIRPVLSLIPSSVLFNNEATGTKNDPYIIKLHDDYEYVPVTGDNFVETIKNKYGTDTTLVAVNTSGTLYDGEGEIREYRYSGPTANNYVFFDTNGDGKKTSDEIWRIVGVFEDTVKDEKGNVINDASGNPTYEEKVKLMRNTVLTSKEMPNSYVINGTTLPIEEGTTGTAYWNYVKTGTNYNDWTTAGLQYYLNTEKDESTNFAYLSFLSIGAKNLLSLTTYHLGNVKIYLEVSDINSVITDTAITAYTSERGSVLCASSINADTHNKNCNIWYGNHATWNGLVGLLYPSDYGYSTKNTYWTEMLSNYDVAAAANSWMQKTANHSYEWFMSPSSSARNLAAPWDSTGEINTYGYINYDPFYVRPVVSLVSNAMVVNSNVAGTINNPYVVVVE